MNSSNIRSSEPLPAQRRHDIDDHTWTLLEPHLPGRKGTWGRYRPRQPAFHQRCLLDIGYWRFLRDLPPDYGDWKNNHRRFCRWRDKEQWEFLLEILIDASDYEWLMIDASHAKVHPHAARTRAGNQAMGRTKGEDVTPRYIWPWLRYMPLRVVITAGTHADCTQADSLIEGNQAEQLLADRGYDSDAIAQKASVAGNASSDTAAKKSQRPQKL